MKFKINSAWLLIVLSVQLALINEGRLSAQQVVFSTQSQPSAIFSQPVQTPHYFSAQPVYPIANYAAPFVGGSMPGPQFFAQREPGYSPYVFARRIPSMELGAIPMQHRPYRPFHFYGNTVRRSYHRGIPVPLPRDIYNMARVTIQRR